MCPGLFGKYLGLYVEHTVLFGGKFYGEMLLVLFSWGKCRWKEYTSLGLFCTLLARMRCSYNPYTWTELLCHIHGPRLFQRNRPKVIQEQWEFLSRYLEINCPPSPLDGSTVLGFHSLPACSKHAFLSTSHYVSLPDNFPAVCIQQEIIFSFGKKKKIKRVGPYFMFPHPHLAIVLCTAHTGVCSFPG